MEGKRGDEAKDELEELQRQCFKRASEVQQPASSSSCRGLGDLLARYKRQGEARAAWKRGCRDGDAGSCWRVALLHYSPSKSHSHSVRKDVIASQDEDGQGPSKQKEPEAESPTMSTAPLPNDKKAAKYAMKACADGANVEGEACVAAGWLTGSQEWWKRGCSRAKHLPACALFAREKTGRLLTACEQDNDATSCYNLGVLSMSGVMDGERNPTRAATFLRQACTKGHADACYNLAQLYRKHVIGTGKENAREAAYFFSLACEAGSADGCFNLGYLFQHGIGCPKDVPLAGKLYHRACTADKPVLDACFNLGVISKQVSFFKRACDSGMQEACRYANRDVASTSDDRDAAGEAKAQQQPPQPDTAKEQQQSRQ